jgi:putative NADPH-quinone reductase|tara:strand:+ start:12695 stop:12859 length:165 start_codon:yes stop_codon:yes gene_type:complete
MRDIEDVKQDLEEAIEQLDVEETEVRLHSMERDSLAREVANLTEELKWAESKKI